jgi:Uma2 family endonuclease
MVTAALITATELEAMPDGERFELFKGALRDMSPPGGRHGKVLARLTRSLSSFVEDKRLGEVYVDSGFVIAREPDTVFAPDLAFVRADRVLPEDAQAGFLHQIPDLAVEIVSPGDRAGQVLEKVMIYLNAGLPVVWTIDPKRQRVMVWDASNLVREFGPGQVLDGGEVLPGFQLPIVDIFGPATSEPVSG